MREHERWKAREREREMGLGGVPVPSLLSDLMALVIFVALALATIAVCGPKGPRDPSWPCHTTQLGADINAATHDTTYWHDSRCPDGSEWRNMQGQQTPMRLK